MSLPAYKTLEKRGAQEFVINKSRFIGRAAPVDAEERALAFIAEVRKANPQAHHNCYAYVLGVNQGVMRYSDDGEPGGTAGMPILEVLRARGLTDCCCVVTRYFGGVLLGAGGLVRAYAQGAAAAVNAAGVALMCPSARYLMDVSYPMLGRVEHYLKGCPVLVEEKAFSEVVTLTLVLRAEHERAFCQGVTEACEGRVEPLKFDEFYRAWPENAQT